MKHLLLSLCFGLIVLVGCSTTNRTVRTETAYEPVRTSAPASESTVVRTESKETTETRSEPEGGILSGTLDIVGKTLALPFKAVGGLIDVIF